MIISISNVEANTRSLAGLDPNRDLQCQQLGHALGVPRPNAGQVRRFAARMGKLSGESQWRCEVTDAAGVTRITRPLISACLRRPLGV